MSSDSLDIAVGPNTSLSPTTIGLVSVAGNIRRAVSTKEFAWVVSPFCVMM